MPFSELNIIDATKFLDNTKARVQKNGTLAFSKEASSIMGLYEGMRLLFSPDQDGTLFAVSGSAEDVRGFAVKKQGDYFCIRLKKFYDSQNMDYTKMIYIYDIFETDEEFNGKRVYKFKFMSRERKFNEEINDEVEEEEIDASFVSNNENNDANDLTTP